MTESERAIYLEEFKATQGRILNFSTVRFSALGAGVTLMAIFISISKDSDSIQMLSYLVIVPLLGRATIRMVGTFNRGCGVLEAHSAWLAEKLGLQSFSKTWLFYIRQNPQDSGVHAFVIAARAVNLLGLLFSIASGAPLLGEERLISGIAVGFMLIATFIAVTNERYIRENIVIDRVFPEIVSRLSEARLRAEASVSEVSPYQPPVEEEDTAVSSLGRSQPSGPQEGSERHED